MIKKVTIKKIVSGIVVGGLVLSFGGIAFADTKTDNNIQKGRRDPSASTGMVRGDKVMGGMKGNLKEGMNIKLQDVLKELVSNSTIAQAKSDELQAYITKKDEDRKAEFEKIKSLSAEDRKAILDKQQTVKVGKGQGMFSDAVKDSIITQEQADAIQGKMVQMAQAAKKKQMTDSLNTIVTAGTITQDQMDKILTYVDREEQSRKEVLEKIKNMTPEQQKEYLKNNAVDRKDFLSQLVTDGTLSKDQADAVSKSLHGGLKGPGPEGGKGHRGRGLKDGKATENSGK